MQRQMRLVKYCPNSHAKRGVAVIAMVTVCVFLREFDWWNYSKDILEHASTCIFLDAQCMNLVWRIY